MANRSRTNMFGISMQTTYCITRSPHPTFVSAETMSNVTLHYKSTQTVKQWRNFKFWAPARKLLKTPSPFPLPLRFFSSCLSLFFLPFSSVLPPTFSSLTSSPSQCSWKVCSNTVSSPVTTYFRDFYTPESASDDIKFRVFALPKTL